MSKPQKIAFFVVGFAIHFSLTIWIFVRIAACDIAVGCVTHMDHVLEKVICFPLIFLSEVVPWVGNGGSTNYQVSWIFFFLMWPINSLIVVTIVYFVFKNFVFSRIKGKL